VEQRGGVWWGRGRGGGGSEGGGGGGPRGRDVWVGVGGRVKRADNSGCRKKHGGGKKGVPWRTKVRLKKPWTERVKTQKNRKEKGKTRSSATYLSSTAGGLEWSQPKDRADPELGTRAR